MNEYMIEDEDIACVHGNTNMIIKNIIYNQYGKYTYYKIISI